MHEHNKASISRHEAAGALAPSATNYHRRRISRSRCDRIISDFLAGARLKPDAVSRAYLALLKRADLFRKHYALAFEYCIEPVHGQVLHAIERPRRPANLHTVDHRCLVQTKMDAQIVL